MKRLIKQLRSRARNKRAFLALVAPLVVLFGATEARADTRVWICNKGDTILNVTTVTEVSTFVWESNWEASGYELIDPGDCERWEVEREVYFGLAYIDTYDNVGFIPSKEGRRDFNFCVKPIDGFNRRGSISDMRDCPSGYVHAPFALYFSEDVTDYNEGTHYTQNVYFSKNDPVPFATTSLNGDASTPIPYGADTPTQGARPNSNNGAQAGARRPSPQSMMQACDGARGCEFDALADGSTIYRPFGTEAWLQESGRPVSMKALPIYSSDEAPRKELLQLRDILNELLANRSFVTNPKVFREAEFILLRPEGTYWSEVHYPALPAVLSSSDKLTIRYARFEFLKNQFGERVFWRSHTSVSFPPADLDIDTLQVRSISGDEASRLTVHCANDDSSKTGKRKRCFTEQARSIIPGSKDISRLDLETNHSGVFELDFASVEEADKAEDAIIEYKESERDSKALVIAFILAVFSVTAATISYIIRDRRRQANNS